MKTAPAKVYDVITPVVTGLDYELLGIEWLQQGKHSLLRIYIDHPDGIAIQDCEKVSRQLSATLDVEDVIHGHYQLEVSSPGLDRPLFSLQQFEQFIGAVVKLVCLLPVNGRRKFRGTIMAVEGENVKLDVDGELIDIPFNAMSKANLVPDFST